MRGRQHEVYAQTFPVSLQSISNGGVIVASYTHEAVGMLLASVTTPSHSETYTYFSPAPDELRQWISEIRRNGQVVTSVTYTADNTGRVASVVAMDGSFSFRYASDPGNSCPVPSRSTLIVDRSTNPVVGLSCTTDLSCGTPPSGNLWVCDSGTCRAATCQEYRAAPGGYDASSPVQVSGNCPCGGGTSYSWTLPPGDAGVGSVDAGVAAQVTPEITAETSRRGLLTTRFLDPLGRVAAECEGDNDSLNDGTPGSCPATGRYVDWTYGDPTWPLKPTQERWRSRLGSGLYATRSYTYDPISGNVLTEVTVGYSENSAGTQVSRTQTVTYHYDLAHRLDWTTGPSTERTEYEYWPAGSGNKNGLLRYVRRRTGGTTFLTTEYQTYTNLGHPTTIVAPEATTTLVWTGHRLDSTTTGGRTTSYTYDSAGRLTQTNAPSGVVTVQRYDAQGRVNIIPLCQRSCRLLIARDVA